MGLAASALFFASCTGEPGDSDLDQHLCTQEDLGQGYHEVTRGNVTRDDLEDLAGGSADLAEMREGRFVFYSQVLGDPPFDPPVSVVCQALEFAGATAAEAWVAGLPAEGSRTPALIGWPPDGSQVVQEVESWELGGASATRFFGVGTFGDSPRSLYLAVGAEGPFVRTVAISGGSFIDPPNDVLASLWEATSAGSQ